MTTPAELYRNAVDLNRFSNGVARRIALTYNDLILEAVSQLKRLDELHTLREKKASRLGTAIEDPVFPDGPNPATTSGTTSNN
jgi:hypothetical protein